MIISRDEFHIRWDPWDFDKVSEEICDFSTKTLFEEIKADAKHRSHSYLFDGTDLSSLEVQESASGIMKSNSKVKTEAELMKEIEKELLNNSYAPVELFQDINDSSVLFVNDGFHRIFVANKLGLGSVRCQIKRGVFKLKNSQRIRDVVKHLDILCAMTQNKGFKKTVEKIKNGLDKEFENGVLFGDVII